MSIRSVREFLDAVFAKHDEWNEQRPSGEPYAIPWFRGEPVVERPLLPSVYRARRLQTENDLLQHFRRMAALPNIGVSLDRKDTDLWLYFARHVGLPTRLLDWTEGALIALYFAARESGPSIVWMLLPQALNMLSELRAFDMPGVPHHLSAAYVRAAWQAGEDPQLKDFPIAIYPTHIHPRLQVQQSCFTIHGRRREGLRDLMEERRAGRHLHAIEIDHRRHETIVNELRILGVAHASLFPDADGLAADLKSQFWRE